jgi:hypothetical protein
MQHLFETELTNQMVYYDLSTKDDFLKHVIKSCKEQLLYNLMDKLDFNVEVIEYSVEAMDDAFNKQDVYMINLLKKLKNEDLIKIKVTLNL